MCVSLINNLFCVCVCVWMRALMYICVFADYAKCSTICVANYIPAHTAGGPCYASLDACENLRRRTGCYRQKQQPRWCWAHLQIYTYSHSLAECGTHQSREPVKENMTRNSAQGSRHFQFAASPSRDKSVI